MKLKLNCFKILVENTSRNLKRNTSASVLIQMWKMIKKIKRSWVRISSKTFVCSFVHSIFFFIFLKIFYEIPSNLIQKIHQRKILMDFNFNVFFLISNPLFPYKRFVFRSQFFLDFISTVDALEMKFDMIVSGLFVLFLFCLFLWKKNFKRKWQSGSFFHYFLN